MRVVNAITQKIVRIINTRIIKIRQGRDWRRSRISALAQHTRTQQKEQSQAQSTASESNTAEQ